MKKIYSFMACLLLAGFMFGQTPLNTAVDFTANDINGVSQNLFTYLNSGKYVCIMFTQNGWSSCTGTYSVLQDSYTHFGCNTGNVIFMAISMNHSTSQMQSGLSAYNFIKIPTPPGSTINTTYSIGAYPTFILIKPDKQIVEKDIWPISNTILRTAVTNAGGVPQSCATSLEENADNSSIFTVYPNPASGYINFNSDGLTDAIYEIYNIIGDKLLSGKTTNNGINRLNISALSEGQYFIKVLSNKGLTSVQKFIVLKQ